MGAHTSQFLATHVYLCGVDHFIKRELKAPGYLRCCDDLFVFGDRRADLRRWRAEIGAWLLEQRHLRLKYPQARVLSCAGRLDALGHRLTRQDIEASGRAWRCFARRIRVELRAPRHRDRRRHLERSVAASVGLLQWP